MKNDTQRKRNPLCLKLSLKNYSELHLGAGVYLMYTD